MNDQFNLNRFVLAQDPIYSQVLRELQNGRKVGHWIWYIFPIVDGLGRSANSRFYSIKSKEEAVAYLSHPVLGKRLVECTQAVLDIQNKTAFEIFYSIDEIKFKSCMTLFAAISPPNSVFLQAIDKYFKGQKCTKTTYFLQLN